MAETAQTFSIDPYAAERSKIARQQKFAELLQSQALQPNEKFSYAGIEAPISAAGGLAKALQAGMSGYLQGDAARKEDAANTKQETDYNAANEAFIRGMSAKPWVNPDTGGPTIRGPRDDDGGPGAMMPTAPAGGLEGATEALAGMQGNSYAGRLSQALLMKKAESDAEQRAAMQKLMLEDEFARRREADKPYILGPGQERFKGDSGVPIASVPAEKKFGVTDPYPELVAQQRIAIAAAGKPPQEQWIPGVGANGEPIQTSSITGERRSAPGKVPDATEYGLKSATFADRMDEAEAVLSLNDPSGLDPAQRGYDMIPGGAYMMSPAYQKISQAERNFVTALLRLESGATISPDEFASARKQYFPQPGDGPEVIAQKAANRATVIAGMKRSAGPKYVPAASARPAVPSKTAAEMNDDEIRKTLGLPPVEPQK